MDDKELDSLFDAARAAPPDLPEGLVARVMADAQAVQPAAPRATGWRGWLRLLGGAPGVGGLITATCFGFWIGVAPPSGVPDLAALVMGSDAITEIETDLYGWDIEEG